MGEKCKISVRNIRREANDELKKLLKNKDISEDDLKTAFEEYGEVSSAKIIFDRYSGRSKGFGFVEMSSDDEAKAAIEALAGKELGGRTMVVNEARPKSQ